MVAISPYARRRFVSHTTYDHTSILRFIETRFDLPALTARDANADPMLELFDFANPPFMTPPLLPAAPIGPRQLEQCIEIASELDES
jgi:phospholipase C